MKKVYLVTHGEYSNYHVLCAFGWEDRNIRLAEGERDARITRAEGEAEANRLINASLTENLLTWATIQKLADKIKVLMVPSEQGLIFDIGSITDEP